MSVKVIIISHLEIGNALLNAAKSAYSDELPLAISTVEVQPDSDPDSLTTELKRISKSLDDGDGVLILADLFGSTPCNIARSLDDPNVTIITGFNLPMLMRVLNYAHLPLTELADKAVEGGKNGILICQCKEKEN